MGDKRDRQAAWLLEQQGQRKGYGAADFTLTTHEPVDVLSSTCTLSAMFSAPGFFGLPPLLSSSVGVSDDPITAALGMSMDSVPPNLTALSCLDGGWQPDAKASPAG